MSRSVQLKEEGNLHYQSGDFVAADSLYSQAILADPKNPALYTNRAMARLKLGLWDSVVSDCDTCLALSPANMKALYYLSHAQLELEDFSAALSNARSAHNLCAASSDKSLSSATSLVLRCKRQFWEDKEKRRTREAQELERELLSMLRSRRDEMLAAEPPHLEAERAAILDESSRKISLLQDFFSRARTQSEQRRLVPEWVVDEISFGVMVDPVITKSGKSYERASIMEHLNRHPTDPLTREPLLVSDLRPNIALRQACDEFLEENGWAVDW